MKTKGQLRCHSAIYIAIRRGDIIRPSSCECCGKQPGRAKDGRARVIAHHVDYRRPLHIQWLCNSCHQIVHRKQA